LRRKPEITEFLGNKYLKLLYINNWTQQRNYLLVMNIFDRDCKYFMLILWFYFILLCINLFAFFVRLLVFLFLSNKRQNNFCQMSPGKVDGMSEWKKNYISSSFFDIVWGNRKIFLLFLTFFQIKKDYELHKLKAKINTPLCLYLYLLESMYVSQ